MVSKVSLTAYALAGCVLAAPLAAHAQASFSFDIPAQSLEKSLRAVASQTSSNIVFSEAAVRGKAAPALHGEFRTVDAYRKLLLGSGLALSVTSGGSYIVGTPQSGGTPTPVASSGSGAILGHVAQADGDRNIAGALIRIVETGQTTIADDAGNFRFPDLKAGQYTLEISFLGFETLSETIAVPAGNATSIDLALTQPGGPGAEIVVYGSRSARANALNLQRTAENNADVISADDLGNFTGTTFSDALRRAPGVSFQRDSITGDGTNVIVRGMEPDMNAVKLNGLNLPVGNGTSRSADLSNLLADSVSKITINKSLLPSQDSSGTGGLIEIETLSPLNRARRYANFQVEGGAGAKGFSDDFLASGTVSGRFGARDNFGLSASVQYRRNSVRNISYNTVTKFGAFLPLPVDPTATDGQAGEAIDPLAQFPFIAGDDKAYTTQLMTSFNHVKQSTLAATVSAEWQIGSHTNLKLDVQHAQSTQTAYSLTDWFSALSKYTDIPGGDAIPALNLSLAPGNAALQHEQQYAYDPDIKKTTDTYSFNGKSTFGKFTLNYLLGYAHGSERHPSYTMLDLRRTAVDAKAEYFLPQATDSKLGYIVTPFAARSGDQIPIPLLSGAGWTYFNDPSQFTIDNGTGQIDDTTGKNDRYTANFSTRWDVGAGFLSYIEAGAHFERTTFRSNLVRTQFGGGATVASLGLPFESMGLDKIGLNGPGFTAMSEKTLTGFLGNIDDYLAKYPNLTLMPIAPADGQDKQSTQEDNYAAYVQTRLQFGKLEIVGGVRYNRTDLAARNLIFPTYIGPILPENGGGFGVDLKFQNQFSKLVTEKASSQDFLPRILFNFRQSDNLIFRGGYFISVARPRIADLSTQTRITVINIPIPGPDGVKPILQISSGNPNLKQATTHNFDLSAEYYHKIGIIKLSGFYKRIDNLLQANQTNGPANLANVTLPDSPYFKGPPYFDPAHPENYFINGGSPINSNHAATIWGIETQVERQFDFLPGALSGLGVFANYTYTHSSRFQQYSWAYAPPGQDNYEFGGLPFISQPKHSGTAALTYNKYGFDATLTYSFQSKSMNNFAPRGLAVYNDKIRTLDFRGEYYFNPKFGKMRIYVEAIDLLKGTSSPDVQTLIGGFYTSATYLGGRKFKLGISSTF